jgi:hypothetical protein
MYVLCRVRCAGAMNTAAGTCGNVFTVSADRTAGLMNFDRGMAHSNRETMKGNEKMSNDKEKVFAVGFKGFNPDMKCLDKQYVENQSKKTFFTR